MMNPENRVVFLLDVDDTLLDNDAAQNDYLEHIRQNLGEQAADRYWTIFQELFKELDYADYLGALQRYRLENLHDPRLLLMSSFLLDYPFRDRLYPHALDVIKHLRQFGLTVILSDGDVIFQPRKVERSGLREAVEGRVLIYVHKEKELADIERFYPADHYVLIDDKPRVVIAVKQRWGKRVTIIQPRQGHYALDLKASGAYPLPDITVERIGDLLNWDFLALSLQTRITK
jgi:FMN phosphatase YigB (HAD superfamily)